MYKIIVKTKFEYAHRLIRHTGNCRFVHGHSGKAVIEFVAQELNENDFVVDFVDIKTPMKRWIDEFWDHSYLANERDLLLPSLLENGMKVFTFSGEPTAEVMAKCLFKQATALECPGVALYRVTVQETCTGSASYYQTSRLK